MSEQSDLDIPGRSATKIGLNVISGVLFLLVLAIGVLVALRSPAIGPRTLIVIGGALGLGALLGLMPRVAAQWERAVVLRLGKFVGLKGPGLFWVIPGVDRVVMWIDRRVRATGFAAEKTLTSDTVPVNVDAVLFWTVTDSKKAALAVEDYQEAVAWAAQTALRDVIGKTDLATMLVGRETIDVEMKKLIDFRTHDWGIAVHSVEIRDVVIPPALEDAMSRQAQAEREKQARVILGDAEVEIAAKFATASEVYQENAVALQLRSLNLLYEGMKERGSLMIVPSTMAGAMDISTYAGLAALGGKGTKSGN